jgi:transposase
MAHITTIVERLRLVNRQWKEAHQQLDALADAFANEKPKPGQKCEQRDVEILRSLPGVGRIVLATLLTEASQPLATRDYQALRSLSGVAPVTRNSGKRSGPRSVVVMRRACSIRLRDAVYHWARIASQHDPKSRVAYAALRARGQTHGRALRAVADRLLAVACAMLRDGTVFDVNRRLAA